MGFKFEIKIDEEKKKKKKLSKNARINICTDQSRVWNMLPIWHFNNSAKDKSRISFLVGYIYDVKKLKDFFNITNLYDFTALTSIRKNSYLSEITKAHKSNPNTRGLDEFYSSTNKNFVVLRRDSNISVRRITGRIQRLFAPRFYHDRKNTHFLRGLKFVGEKKRNWWNRFFRHKNTG